MAAECPSATAGWTVTSLVRPGSFPRARRRRPAPRVVEIDALDHARGQRSGPGGRPDVILHALNPFYTNWSRFALPLAYSGHLPAAEAAGATLMFPRQISTITVRPCRP